MRKNIFLFYQIVLTILCVTSIFSDVYATGTEKCASGVTYTVCPSDSYYGSNWSYYYDTTNGACSMEDMGSCFWTMPSDSASDCENDTCN